MNNFDSVFLLKMLAEYSSTFSIIKREENIVKVNVSKKWSSDPKNVTKLVFLDSYLLLPEELAKLSHAFAGAVKGNVNFVKVNQSQNLLLIKDEIITNKIA